MTRRGGCVSAGRGGYRHLRRGSRRVPTPSGKVSEVSQHHLLDHLVFEWHQYKRGPGDQADSADWQRRAGGWAPPRRHRPAESTCQGQISSSQAAVRAGEVPAATKGSPLRLPISTTGGQVADRPRARPDGQATPKSSPGTPQPWPHRRHHGPPAGPAGRIRRGPAVLYLRCGRRPGSPTRPGPGGGRPDPGLHDREGFYSGFRGLG